MASPDYLEKLSEEDRKFVLEDEKDRGNIIEWPHTHPVKFICAVLFAGAVVMALFKDNLNLTKAPGTKQDSAKVIMPTAHDSAQIKATMHLFDVPRP